jgi:hypothetical protein
MKMQQSIKPKTSPVVILLMLVIVALLGTIVFQNFTSKNSQLQPAAPMVTAIQPTTTSEPLSLIQAEIDKLRNQVSDLQREKNTGWLDVLVVSAPTLVWVIFIGFVILIFMSPLSTIAQNLANRASNSIIEVNGIKIGSNEVGNAIEGQEILRIALKLSNADKGDAEEKELRFIAQQADSMNDGREYLSKENKNKVLSVAIRVALMDAEFSEAEYEEILIQANRYGFTGEDIDKLHEEMVNEMLIRRHSISSTDAHNAVAANDVIPPPQLRNRYETAKRNIKAPAP